MPVKYYDNPKVTDQIEFDFYTPDANGCFLSDPFTVDNLKIYFVERDLNGIKNSLTLVDQFNVVAQRAYLDAKEASCADPTDQEKAALSFKLQKQFEATSVFNPIYYSKADVISNIGSAANPVWPNTESPITKLDDGINGHFQFIWSPNGSIREGDFYLCWTWTPLENGNAFSEYQHFYVSGNIANEVANPSHVVDSTQYKKLLDNYLPEMYKLSYSQNDLTVDVLEKLNSAIADGFTVLDNLGTQLLDITDANATQQPILPYLAQFFGTPLRSMDPTLWRRQLKRAVPLLKKKGTIDGLIESLGNAGIRLLKYTQLWQCGTGNVFTETFKYEGSTDFILTQTSLGIEEPYFTIEKRSITGEYESQDLLDITISTIDGISTMIWAGLPLVIGDMLKITYMIKEFSGTDLDLYNIAMGLPLLDQRDDKDFEYPPKDWNTRLIAEDDVDFDTIISQKNPFVDYLYFGKVRTKFPYSENVYNMDEYNGSLRDSEIPCDIDKRFIEPCRNAISSYYMLDVEIEKLSDDRLNECRQIIADYTPFHAVLHSLNFSGYFEDIVLPPVESIDRLVQYNPKEFMIAGMAQMVFNRVMKFGLTDNKIQRDALATELTASNLSATVNAYNEKIMLFCPTTNFNTIGIKNLDTNTLLEITSSAFPYPSYNVQNPDKYYIQVSQTVPVSEPLDISTFSFRLSNINLALTDFLITQITIDAVVYGKVTLPSSPASNYIKKNGYFYDDTSDIQYPFYSYVDGDDLSFLISGWLGGNVTIAGKLLARLVENQTGNFGYRGMVLQWDSPLPIFNDINDPSYYTPGATDDQNFIWNYIIKDNSNILYCIVDTFSVGPIDYVKIDGPLQTFGVTASSSFDINLYRYSKNSIELFGQDLTNISRGGQDIFNTVTDMMLPFMSMAEEKPSINDNMISNEFLSVKIEYKNGQVKTGDLK